MVANPAELLKAIQVNHEIKILALQSLQSDGLPRRDARKVLNSIKQEITTTGVEALLIARTLLNGTAGRRLDPHDRQKRVEQLSDRARLFMYLRRARPAEDSYASYRNALPASPLEIARTVKQYLTALDSASTDLINPTFEFTAGLFNGASPVGSGAIY